MAKELPAVKVEQGLLAVIQVVLITLVLVGGAQVVNVVDKHRQVTIVLAPHMALPKAMEVTMEGE